MAAGTGPPLVSCLIAVYNGERYLSEAIESVLCQTYTPVEIVVVDDGSVDGTRRAVEAFGRRVRATFGPHEGLASARNRGVQAARGDLISFLDADDVWLPTKLARQVERLRATPEIDMVLTGIQNFWAAGASHEAERYRGRRYAEPLPGYSCCTLLARREVLQRVGAFADLPLVEDVDWFLRAREMGVRHELLPDVLVRRRLHGANVSLVHRDRIADALLELARRTVERRRSQAGRPHVTGSK